SVTGQADVDGVMAAVQAALPLDSSPFTNLLPTASSRSATAVVPPVRLTPRHYPYLKIAEGSDHLCRFCIIPTLRLLQASRPAAELLFEARRMIATGTKEIMLIAQDSSAYGNDLRHATSTFDERQVRAHLVDLVTEMAAFGAWLRLH